MSKVILPYCEPMYLTYNYLSVIGVPAKQNNTSDIWYYNNTVQWSCMRKFLHGYTSPLINLRIGEIKEYPFLYQSVVNYRFTEKNISDIIKRMIDSGFYVAFSGVDDYYVKGKSWYKEKHFNHDGLIIGYNEKNEGNKENKNKAENSENKIENSANKAGKTENCEEDTFFIASYNNRWIFTVFETPQKCFFEGMKACIKNGEYGCIEALKANNKKISLDLKFIRETVEDYIFSKSFDYSFNKSDAVLGIAVYDFICMYFDKLLDGSIPYERKDRRILRLIWEHKKCMQKRIEYCENYCGWDNSLSEEYKKIVVLADKARFIYSKFVLKYSALDIEKIQQLLMLIKQKEFKLLKKFDKKLASVTSPIDRSL